MERFFSNIVGDSKIAAFFVLGRPWNGLFVALLTIIGAFITSSTIPNTFLLLIGGIITLLVYMGSTTLNDVYDIRIDLINMPYRPLQKNIISTRAAKMFAYLLFSISIIGSFLISIQYFIIIIIMIIIGATYSVPPINFKNRSIFGNLFLSIDTIFITLISGFILINSSFLFPPNFIYVVILLTLSFFLISMSKDFKDIKGDRAFGKITSVIYFGKKSMIISIIIGKILLSCTLFYLYYQFIPNNLFLFLSFGLVFLLIFIPLNMYRNKFNIDTVENAWSLERAILLLIIIILLIFLYLNHL